VSRVSFNFANSGGVRRRIPHGDITVLPVSVTSTYEALLH